MTIRRTITLTFGSGFTLGELREFVGAVSDLDGDTPVEVRPEGLTITY
jgi:hypothetical protein